eukprot:2041112-Rhodomonas_salina.2
MSSLVIEFKPWSADRDDPRMATLPFGGNIVNTRVLRIPGRMHEGAPVRTRCCERHFSELASFPISIVALYRCVDTDLHWNRGIRVHHGHN